ncbi:MAG TPA: PDZ domain-containing protein [Acidobacteriaceae bacterium]|jgi:S1-C subfamily serine protease|nr:PDZ domain-containing protein [Acidobacteriaceae bacterium]
MKSFAVTILAGCISLAPSLVAQHINILGDDAALLTHPAAGYLGVGTRDITNERAGQLKLKGARGAEVITVDHDAPACKAGMLVHDVILQMNNQPVEGEAQLGRLLRDTPAGRTVTFLISRDGQQQSISVQLVDRSTLEADAWSQHIPVEPDQDDGLSLPSPQSSFGSSFLSALGMNPAYTGLELDMLGPQLADFFGVHDGQGLLVKRVDDNSPGSAAGLRAGDVITKVNGRIVATTSQWMRTMHANRGKQVQLTVMRDRKEATVTMTAGRSKDKGQLETQGGLA